MRVSMSVPPRDMAAPEYRHIIARHYRGYMRVSLLPLLHMPPALHLSCGDIRSMLGLGKVLGTWDIDVHTQLI